MITSLRGFGAGHGLERAFAQPEIQYNDPKGVQVLTRGPVHEAFAETVTFNPEPGILVPRAPRAIIEEVPPDQRPEGINVAWIPGYWAWDDERSDFLWISGTWRDVPPGRQWVPGYWGQSGQQYQWTSGFWADAALSDTEYLPEPPESVEIGPSSAAPAANQDWMPGTWVWQQNRYSWRPGYWAAGRADWVWVPAHYIWAPRGYVFTDGYWDHTMERRGVLFAPVYFDQEVYSRPNYSYSPSFAINISVISEQLFVRPRYQHYYFGDYYDRRYQDTGFFASFSFHSSRQGYEPIYSHRRWQHRGDRDWARRDSDNFNRRRDSADARPPRTLQAQRERSLRTPRLGDDRTEIASLFDRQTKRTDSPIRYQKVDNAERAQLGQRGRGIQEARNERQNLESKAQPIVARKASKSVEPVRGKLPRPVIVARPQDRAVAGRSPPRVQRVPALNPKVEPKARQIDRKPVVTREQPQIDKRDNKSPPSRGQAGPSQAEAKRNPRTENPKRESKGESREDSKDGKKPKKGP